jgi:hypothetical protein
MIEKLNRHYSMTNPASVYDEEALTALELAARTTGKVNEMVDRVNEIPQDVENAVDNVLNGGTFDVLIDRKLNNINKRFENLSGKLTEGSTTFDAEIVDARVDNSGHVYTNLGAAVRGMEAQTKREIDRFVSVNRLNPDTTVSGYIHPTNGTHAENATYKVTDFIAIAEGETLGLFFEDMSPRQMRFVAAYDKNKEFIGEKGATDVLGYTQSGDVGFVRIAYRVAIGTNDRIMICNADTVSFSKYGDGTLVHSVMPDNVANVTEKLVYTNRYHTGDKENGTYINYATGLAQINTNYFSTGFIRVTEGERLSLFNERMETVPIRMGAYFDREGMYLTGFSVETKVITVPARACFVRFSVKTEYDGKLMLTTPEAHKFVNRGDYAIRGGAVGGVGGGGIVTPHKVSVYQADRVEANTTIYLNDFPRYNVSPYAIRIFARATDGARLTIGQGGAEQPEYGSKWLEINGNEYTVYTHTTETVVTKQSTGTISNGYFVITMGITETSYMIMLDKDGMQYILHNETIGSPVTGVPFLKVSAPLDNVGFSAVSANLYSDVWIFGDSYMGKASNRVYGKFPAKTNVFVDAMAGMGSVKAYDELNRVLNLHKPKTLVWYVGINDDFETYSRYVPLVKELCETNGISLVLNCVPSTPTLDRTQHQEYVKNSGERYVDSWGAVGKTVSWDDGCLDTDNTHPTEKGAHILYHRLCADVPEIVKENMKL